MEDKVFTTHGNVLDEEGGGHFTFYPGMRMSEVPERLHHKFTNPKLWDKKPAFGQSNVPGDTGQPNYEALTVPQLMRLVKERGLSPASTKKADLIFALAENDIP